MKVSGPGCVLRGGGRARMMSCPLLSKQSVSSGFAINCLCLSPEFIGPVPGKLVKVQMTNPKTPLLRTKQRFRPVTCKPTAELEAEELEKIQQ